MKRIKDEDLKDINGGVSGWVIAGVGMLITFIAGILDGIARPAKCHN